MVVRVRAASLNLDSFALSSPSHNCPVRFDKMPRTSPRGPAEALLARQQLDDMKRARDESKLQQKLEEMQKQQAELAKRMELQQLEQQAALNSVVASAVQAALKSQLPAPAPPTSPPTAVPIPPAHSRDAPRLGNRPQRGPYGSRPIASAPCRASGGLTSSGRLLAASPAPPEEAPAYAGGSSSTDKPDFDLKPARSGGCFDQQSKHSMVSWNRTRRVESRWERELEKTRRELTSTLQKLREAEKRAQTAAANLRDQLGPLKRRAREAEMAFDRERAQNEQRRREAEASHAEALAVQAARNESDAAQKELQWRERERATKEKMLIQSEQYEQQLRDLRRTLQTDERAAIQIQAARRSAAAQKEWDEKKKATLAVQKAGRRRSAKQKYDWLRLAASYIQAVWRGILFRKFMTELRVAVIRVQRSYRSHMTRQRLLRAIAQARKRRHLAANAMIGVSGGANAFGGGRR